MTYKLGIIVELWIVAEPVLLQLQKGEIIKIYLTQLFEN